MAFPKEAGKQSTISLELIGNKKAPLVPGVSRENLVVLSQAIQNMNSGTMQSGREPVNIRFQLP